VRAAEGIVGPNQLVGTQDLLGDLLQMFQDMLQSLEFIILALLVHSAPLNRAVHRPWCRSLQLKTFRYYSPQTVIFGLIHRLCETHRIVSKCLVGFRSSNETFYLRFVLHQGLNVVIVCVSASEVTLFGAWHDSRYGLEIFYQSGMSYFESDSLDVSWATKVQMALALQTMPADVGKLILTMVLQPGVEINVALLACFPGNHPEKKTQKKKKNKK
jgi:hypothetical protein